MERGLAALERETSVRRCCCGRPTVRLTTDVGGFLRIQQKREHEGIY